MGATIDATRNNKDLQAKRNRKIQEWTSLKREPLQQADLQWEMLSNLQSSLLTIQPSLSSLPFPLSPTLSSSLHPSYLIFYVFLSKNFNPGEEFVSKSSLLEWSDAAICFTGQQLGLAKSFNREPCYFRLHGRQALPKLKELHVQPQGFKENIFEAHS